MNDRELLHKVLDALEIAKTFIAEELECRERSGMVENSIYISEARVALEVVVLAESSAKAALAWPEQIESRAGSDYQQGFEDGMAEAILASELPQSEQEPTLSPRPYNELPRHPMFDAFIRALKEQK